MPSIIPTINSASAAAFLLRLNGTLEIKEEGIRRGMQDIIMATLTAMLEWRKHNNKVLSMVEGASCCDMLQTVWGLIAVPYMQVWIIAAAAI